MYYAALAKKRRKCNKLKAKITATQVSFQRGRRCIEVWPFVLAQVPRNINALIVYFTEKLDPWEFSDELLLLLLGAVLVSVMSIFFRHCTIWAPANGDVTQCFLRGNTQAAKKKKTYWSCCLSCRKGNYCKGPTILLLGKGLVIPFGKDFFLRTSSSWWVIYLGCCVFQCFLRSEILRVHT